MSEWKTIRRFPNKRILYVEDCDFTSDLVADYLQFVGCEVENCTTGSQALKLFHSYDFDLIVLDLNLPDKDGITVAKEIRESKKGNNKTPIVAFSVRAIANSEQLKEAGIDEYIQKPFDMNVFGKMLSHYLSE